MEASPADPIARFAELVERAERTRGVRFAELRELAGLYRRGVARLSQLRTENRDVDAIRYLNSLCLRAYPFTYAAPRRNWSFAWDGLPKALARSWPVQLLVLSLLFSGSFVGAVLVAEDPAHLPGLMPLYPAAKLERLVGSQEARGEFLARRDVNALQNTMFGTSLFANNTSVGLLAFATGILGAVPTVLLVVYNGMMLGGFCMIFAGDADAIRFWAWLVPHAVPELLAVVLCATAGMLLGIAVLAPGRRGSLALRDAGEHALHLVLASIPLFVMAALIESFVRESTLSTSVRFSFGAAAALLVVAYVSMVVRLARRTDPIDLGWLR